MEQGKSSALLKGEGTAKGGILRSQSRRSVLGRKVGDREVGETQDRKDGEYRKGAGDREVKVYE